MLNPAAERPRYFCSTMRMTRNITSADALISEAYDCVLAGETAVYVALLSVEEGPERATFLAVRAEAPQVVSGTVQDATPPATAR